MNEKKNDEIKLTIPNKPEYVSVVRLTVSSIANRMGFDVEQIEDIKIATAEACTNAITHGKCDVEESFDIKFIIDEGKLVISVFDNGKGCMINNIKKPDLINPKEGGLGIFIIKSLMDDVKITSDADKGTTIIMTKYVGEDT
ncbi:putative anti-sigma regulatory factor, serine/threonine protein kinase [Alkaliphilus metalliredigens QYMF]|uniref:Putative anti-sigma regulatory factor, serine/threonine protein kinase n=1 Tax=Alkaliphilus metalliredigens (strain QYMF) TaxID=293826 RepID=A6TJ84_ALKMQ|nr:ATP-binding protein [Alkaliphilus metalliredigens]ABR46252.1 putative anti-sigma regulatory factor, serine/threonine protein kinase [Alkaliphilus metalliredigens QYMF]